MLTRAGQEHQRRDRRQTERRRDHAGRRPDIGLGVRAGVDAEERPEEDRLGRYEQGHAHHGAAGAANRPVRSSSAGSGSAGAGGASCRHLRGSATARPAAGRAPVAGRDRGAAESKLCGGGGEDVAHSRVLPSQDRRARSAAVRSVTTRLTSATSIASGDDVGRRHGLDHVQRAPARSARVGGHPARHPARPRKCIGKNVTLNPMNISQKCSSRAAVEESARSSWGTSSTSRP